MKKALLKSLIVASLFSAVNAQALTQKEEAAKLGASEVTEVRFDRSSHKLTKESQQQLKEALAEAEKNGKIKAVKILTWSDKEYPTDEAKEEGKDIKLADQRVTTLKDYVKKDLKVWDVGTYNMAERPSKIEKLFRTQDAQVKESAEQAGIAPNTKTKLGLFDRNAHASKAVVLIYMK